mmetsp:Transcript_28842/g.84550  ORF Transcript_28842/g.84550 Transcript_28842/m.84550 type:complete len:728 (+) Transcript_28842:72-2255(+)
MVALRCANCPSQDLALTNCVFLNPADFAALPGEEPRYVEVKQLVYTARAAAEVPAGGLGLNSVQRKLLAVSVGDELVAEPFALPPDGVAICRCTLEVDFVRKAMVRGVAQVDGSKLAEAVTRRYAHQVLTVGQQWAMDFEGQNILLKVAALTTASFAELTAPNATGVEAGRGLLNPQAFVVLAKAAGAPLQLVGMEAGRQGASQIIRSDFNFEQMGIGGLDAEFSDIFRRAFASRIFPPAVLKQLGVTHVRGMLLFGPPGTGKTLMARQIGKMLNGREPKVVNGPEILSKYVGQSEENIRKLFADAEKEQAERGDDSDLHILIFDEIDAICKQRGTRGDSTGVHDTVVNQLLSKIDGVEALNNILLIGMTNRKDMIDEALLRPGRLEVQVEIHLPDAAGRAQILRIKTSDMRKGGYLEADVDLADLAERTKNFSGAELEGLVKSATSFAFNRQVHVDNLKDVSVDNLRITRQDFDRALGEVKPAFGIAGEDLAALTAGGIVDYGPQLRHLQATADGFMKHLRSSQRVSRMAILLEGPPGAGKTALAAHLALRSEWPFVKLVSPDRYVGMGEQAKSAAIAKVFDDALKSPLSCVVLDDLERLLEYFRIGPRFSTVLLQTLLVCIKRSPTRGRLFVIATSSSASVLEALEVLDTFNAVLPVRCLDADEAATVMADAGGMAPADVAAARAALPANGVAIKKLLLVLEMAAGPGGKVAADDFIRCLHEVSN